MKRGYTFTLLFMLAVSTIFTALLATANAFAQPQIIENQTLAVQRSILYTLNIDTGASADEIRATYESQIREVQVDGRTLYAAVDASGNELAYAVFFRGPGLWGTIEGFLGISADYTSLTGIVFTAHSETPGLGGRIDEAWYKEQFRGVLLPENKTLSIRPAGGVGDVDAITGATSTSRSVMSLVNTTLGELPAKGGN